MSENPPPARRRGAPQGNTNALRHGFYSRKLPPAEIADAQTHNFTGLVEEIALLRVIIRRVAALANTAETFQQNLDLLRGLSLSLISLARVIQAHTILNPTNPIGEAIDQAINNILNQIKNDSPTPDPALNLKNNSPNPQIPSSTELFRIEP